MDWMDLAHSCIWDRATGFGGDGEVAGASTVGDGRCVTDGPFTQLQPTWYDDAYIPHCLSRGFRDGDIVGRLPNSEFSPEWMGHIMRSPNYTTVIRHIELYLHNVIHHAIAGDFLVVTAANGESLLFAAPP